ncbi:MAG: hypothetical protein KBG38_05290 [Candidatus Cloacimonas sp.]|jgi:bifunctional N-acetylglucosamine-1-phosphate-uridyltransferase/glucosamine-1-phosphate-acetyltransferase GlmU-like protein|nr:hypothetical protein [Candidatus Cloacimonas sp.]
MVNEDKIIELIEKGKQLGNMFSFDRSGKTIWSSVGIQKWQDIYKVYVDEIEEENMEAEIYLRDEINYFDNARDALKYIDEKTETNSLELHPCKGQKIFNPGF